jgi:subtilisin family serine protease
MEKEYIVSLNRGVDYDQFWDQIENASEDDGFVPTRRVDIINERPGSLRSCHYSLTDDEANALRNDPRVYGVEIPPEQRDDIQIGLTATQTADFTKTSSNSGNFVNWGLRRSIFEAIPSFGSSDDYTYNLDGSGVDIVIQDSGLQVDHPEFEDADGVSRVQLIDWYTESGLPGTQNANFYRDLDGHGTHCGGIAAGKTYGWAKNARIYSMKVAGLEGTGDSGTGISVSDCFDTIKLWHRNKPVDPATGYKRPTIVNMSWGYSTFYDTVSSVTYRGTTFTDANTTGNSTYRWQNYGIVPLSGASAGYNYSGPVRISSVDVDVQELIDEGIHVCIAAGNNYHKADVLGGSDYNNSMVTDTGTKFFHRGGSPFDDEAFMVGNMDSTLNGGGLEQKANSSTTGPAVDIYAAGTNIMSCTSTINKFSGTDYPPDPTYKICNIGGTSMASPQVCGVGALFLQLNPHSTPAQLKNAIISNSYTSGLYTGTVDDYDDQNNLLGGNNRILYNPFNDPIQYRISNIDDTTYDIFPPFNNYSDTTYSSLIDDIWVNNEGTIIIGVDSGADSIVKYTLTTPHDLSTISPTVQNVSISGDSTATGSGIQVKPDGTRLYVGTTSETILTYSMSTPFDLSTLSLIHTLDLSAIGAADLRAFQISPDGTKMIASDASTLDSYEITTPWDLSGTVTNIGSGDPNGSYFSLSVSPDGTKIFYSDFNANRSRNYRLSVPWDVTSEATLLYEVPNVDYFDSHWWADDGKSLYNLSNNTIQRWTTPVPYETPHRELRRNVNIDADGITFKPNSESHFFINNNRLIQEYIMTTPGDISTAVLQANSFGVSGEMNTAYNIQFKPDGTKLFVDGDNTIGLRSVTAYDLSVPWDLTTATYNGETFTAEGSGPGFSDLLKNLFITPDGSKFYLVSAGDMYLFNLSTPWDISTASYDSKTFDTGFVDHYSFTFNSTGTELWFRQNAFAYNLRSYTLSIPFAPTDDTNTLNYIFDMGDILGSEQLTFNGTGTRFYVAANSQVLEYVSISRFW